MATATLRFYEELNDYLPPSERKRDQRVEFAPPCPLRHLIESSGVPHTEVEIILLNGKSVGLEHPVHDGDRISVYPTFEALDISPLLRLRPYPLRDTKFFADAHLGRLARYLRLLGFDTLYENGIGDTELAQRAADEHRIVLTRDLQLLMRRSITHGCHIRQDDPIEQLQYVVQRCDLRGLAQPFRRCMECNGAIEAVARQLIDAKLDPITRSSFTEFWQCRGCGRIYWKGSHYERLQRLIAEALSAAPVE